MNAYIQRSARIVLAIIAIVLLLVLPTFAIGRSLYEQYLETEAFTLEAIR